MVRIKNVLRNKRGQSLVETALMLPLLLLVLMGIVEFGRIFNSYLIITNASREGARYAAVRSSDAEIMSAVSTLTSTLKQDSMTVTISPSLSNRTSGTAATVRVDYNLDIIAPFVNTITGDPFKVSAQTTMRIE